MYNLIDYFIDYIVYEKNYSSNTAGDYRSDLLQLADFLTGRVSDGFKGYYELDCIVSDNEPELSTVTISDLRSFIEYCYDRKLKRSSIERKIAVIKSFLTFLYRKEIITSNPSKKLIYPKKERRLPKTFWKAFGKSIFFKRVRNRTLQGKRGGIRFAGGLLFCLRLYKRKLRA